MPEQGRGMPPEGWYVDVKGVAELRWWDGAQWTENTQGVAGMASALGLPAVGALPGAAVAVAEPAISRRQLREQVGSLTVGAPDESPQEQQLQAQPWQAQQPESPAQPWQAQQPESPAQPWQAQQPQWQQPQVAVREHYSPQVVQSSLIDDDLTPMERARRAAGYAPREPVAQPMAYAAENVSWRGSAQSVAGWFYATAALWVGIPAGVLTAAIPTLAPWISSLVTIVIAIVASLLLARADGKRLRANGYRHVPFGWGLIPLVFHILRLVRTGARGVPIFLTALLLPWLLFGIGLAVYGAQYAATHTNASTQTTPQSVDQLPAPHVLTDEERAAILSTGYPAELAADITFSGHEVGQVECGPFTDTDTGTFAACNIEVDGAPYSVVLVATPEDPEYAWGYDSVTPWTTNDGGSTETSPSIQS